MLAHERNHLPAHVITIDRVNVDAVQKRLSRWHARRFVSARTQTSFDKLSRHRLAEIVGQRRQHHRYLPRVGKLVDQLPCPVERQSRMHKYVTLGMPLGILGHTDQRINLRKQLLQYAQRVQPAEPDRRLPRAQQQLLQLTPNPLSRQVRKIDPATKLNRFPRHAKLETRRKLRG